MPGKAGERLAAELLRRPEIALVENGRNSSCETLVV
jgi:hypothetical protein